MVTRGGGARAITSCRAVRDVDSSLSESRGAGGRAYQWKEAGMGWGWWVSEAEGGALFFALRGGRWEPKGGGTQGGLVLAKPSRRPSKHSTSAAPLPRETETNMSHVVLIKSCVRARVVSKSDGRRRARGMPREDGARGRKGKKAWMKKERGGIVRTRNAEGGGGPRRPLPLSISSCVGLWCGFIAREGLHHAVLLCVARSAATNGPNQKLTPTL